MKYWLPSSQQIPSAECSPECTALSNPKDKYKAKNKAKVKKEPSNVVGTTYIDSEGICDLPNLPKFNPRKRGTSGEYSDLLTTAAAPKISASVGLCAFAIDVLKIGVPLRTARAIK